MSKKKPAQKTPASSPQQKASSNKNSSGTRKQWIALSVIAVLAYIVFLPSDDVQFTNWDDGTYVSENPMIWKLDGKTVKEIFSTPISLNYHPFAMLSLAINYSYSGLNAKPYVITNNILHILNVILVFIFFSALIEQWNRKKPADSFRPDPFYISLIVSALWAIHPMRVESVTWIAERKDVLYVFFFFLSLIFYLRWLERKKITAAVFCFLFFVCSCLSKGMAVILPVILVLMDWFLGDAKTIKQIFRSILAKAHFFIASAVFGVIAFKIQSQGAIAAMETFTLFQRLTFGCYGFIMYIWKLFLPVNLSAFYPYPFTDAQGNIPAIYYASPFIVLAFALTVIFLLWKKPETGKIIAFGFGFYFISVALVLQFLSVGSVIMADRYSYLSYIGLLFMIACFFEYVRKKYSSAISGIFAGALVISAGYLSYLSRERVKIWTNAETLWTDAMNQFPFIEIAYENRGIFYKDKFEKTKDIAWLDKMRRDYEIITGLKNDSIKLAPTRNEKIWSNLGNLYGLYGQQKDKSYFEKSLNAYSHAIEINPQNSSTYLNRAITYSMMGQYEKSIPDFDKSIELAPEVALTYKNRGYTLMQLGRYEKSISDYDKALQLFPYDTLSYLNRGISKFNGKMYPEALEDFRKFIFMSPKNAAAYYNASVSHKNMGQFSEALQMAQMAQKLGQQISPDYIMELEAKAKQK